MGSPLPAQQSGTTATPEWAGGQATAARHFRQLALPFLLALTGFVVTGYFGYSATRDMIDNQRSEVRARSVVLELQRLMALAVNAETGQRGYVITGAEHYLVPYRAGADEMPEVLSRLRLQLTDDRAQLARLDNFEQLQQLKFDELQESIRVRREQGFEAAQQIVATDRGRNFMMGMRTEVAEMTDAENRKLDTRIAQADESASDAARTIVFAGFANTALLVAVLLTVRARNKTQRKAAQALEDAQMLLRGIVDGSPAMIYLKDMAGRFILANKAFEEFVRRPSAEVIGKSSAELFPAAVARFQEQTDRQAIETGHTSQFEESLEDSNGNRRYLLSAKIALHDRKGKLIGICGVASDVTSLKVAESEIRDLNRTLERRVEQRTVQLADVNAQLQEANGQLEAFSYTVAHDLRAPLRGIQGFAQAVAEDYGPVLDDTGRDYLQRIERAAIRMERLIEDLLEFARLSRADLPLTSLCLDDVVTQALRLLGSQAADCGARIERQPIPHQVRGNHAACVQVVQNLVSNSMKYIKPGTTPEIRIWSDAPDGARVRLYVQDAGIGIAAEQQARIFRPFERLHGHGEFSGSGIGLAIVDKATQRMGGACGVDSVAGGGAVFWIELAAAGRPIAKEQA